MRESVVIKFQGFKTRNDFSRLDIHYYKTGVVFFIFYFKKTLSIFVSNVCKMKAEIDTLSTGIQTLTLVTKKTTNL